jgi:hypothetical protein
MSQISRVVLFILLTASPAWAAMPTFQALGTHAAGTGAITPGLPAAASSDDIFLLFCETANEAVTISNANGGTWTEVADSPQSAATAGLEARLTVFWSRNNGTQGDPTVADAGDHTHCRIAGFRGVRLSGDPWNVTSGGTEDVGDTSLSVTGDTTTAADCLVVIVSAGNPDQAGDGDDTGYSAWANADLATVTERMDVGAAAGNGGTMGMATGEKAAAGAYGSTTATIDQTTRKAFMTIALEGAVVVGCRGGMMRGGFGC